LAANQSQDRYLGSELTMLHDTNIGGLVDQIVERNRIVFERQGVGDHLVRNALTVASWPAIAIHYRPLSEQAPIVCDSADDLDLMRGLLLDCVERCPECFGDEITDHIGPGITCFDENGDEIPLPEIDIDEATLLRARATRLLRQRQEAIAANEIELRTLAATGGSDELVAELRRAHERWVKPAEAILGDRPLGDGERVSLLAALDEPSTAAAWPAMAEHYATLAKQSPALCIAFDRADLLRRLLGEMLRGVGEGAAAE